MIPPCLTLSNIRFVSRVKWSTPGKGVAPFPTPRCSSYWKGSLLVALDYGRRLTYVAEWISHFCLTRNLIRPLGLTHNFTQSGWLILFNPDHLSGQHKLGKSAKHFFSQNSFVQYRRLTVSSSIAAAEAAAASHHHEGSSLIHGPLASILIDQGFPVEYELDEFNTPHTGTTLRHPQNRLCRLRCKNSTLTPSYFTSEQHFLETFMLLPETTRTTNSRWLQSFPSSNSKHDFCYTMANISPSHIQQCLNQTMHFSLSHLAAKILSQLHNNFISFPYFFPSYETGSINVNPLFHAVIKNLHRKPYGIFVFVLLHPSFISNNN